MRGGVGERLVLREEDAGAFTSERGFDVVVSVGATHAFGGLMGTLAAARRHLAPGGRVLVGDAYWESEPSAEVRQMLGEYEWALGHPDDPRGQEALAVAERHRAEWLHGYRDCFGFLTLVLRPTP